MSTVSTITAPMMPRGFVTKAGTLAAGTALAGAALFGGAAVAPTVAAGLTASVQRDFVLTATPAPEVDTFVASLQNLLDTLKFGDMGQVLGAFGTTANPISTTSDLSALLAALNPHDVSLDTVTGGLLSTDISALLNDVQIPTGVGATAPLGEVPIDALIGGFLGGTGASESIGAVLTSLGLGPFVGLLDLPMLGLSPTDTVGSLLDSMLGIGTTTSINDLLTSNGMTDATIGGLLGIDGTQLAAGWDQFVDHITVGGTVMDPTGTGILGDETLGALLTSLLGSGATSPVTDATTLTDFLGDLGIFHMLGLS